MNNNVNAIRVLGIDMVQKANSGHPGIVMGAAPIMYTLFTKHLVIDPENDKNKIRDRFVLSAGHGSAMLYSTLYLCGLGLSIDDLKNFRQLNSKTPGHPEITHTKFVDSTSGPLGQGIAQAVGMSLAKKHNSAKYNKYSEVICNNTYVLCGDGDLQEGVAHEASSLAGHFNLDDLIIIWDSNDIQLDSEVDVASSENIKARYEAYGFSYILVNDGENLDEIDKAISKAKENNVPTLIEVKTKIGFGSPNKEGKTDAHGAPLGIEEVKLVKQNYSWDYDPFEIPNDILEYFNNSVKERFELKNKFYNEQVEILKQKDQKLYNEYEKVISNNVNYDLNFEYKNPGDIVATRVASGEALNCINNQISNLIGGSADLAKSNNSILHKSGVFSKETPENKNIPFGVREFGMAAITNGINLYEMNKVFCSTFFVFSDYLKPAIRMSAIQEIPTIYTFTHDSIAVGEDGPTHEPIEQITGLRAIPNVNVIRPADYNETQMAYNIALQSKSTPTILVLSRQNLEVVTTKNDVKNMEFGGYVLSDSEDFDKVLIASGSEVSLAMKLKEELEAKKIKTRVVSMPCTNVFDKQPIKYQDEVLGRGKIRCKDRFFIEMSTATIGYKYAKNVINIEEFGKSGPGDEVIVDYGFTIELVNKIIN